MSFLEYLFGLWTYQAEIFGVFAFIALFLVFFLKKNKKELYCYEYPRPVVAASVIIFSYINKELHVLLGKRNSNSDAYPNYWCVPGGILNAKSNKFEGETVEQTALREIKEEISMQLDENRIKLVGISSHPETDPRFHVISVFYMTVIDSSNLNIVADDDITDTKWVNVNNLLEDNNQLAFDHKQWINNAYRLF